MIIDLKPHLVFAKNTLHFLKVLAALTISIFSLTGTSEVLAENVTFEPNILVSTAPGYGGDNGEALVMDIDNTGNMHSAWVGQKDSMRDVFYSKLEQTTNTTSNDIPLTGISSTKTLPQIQADNEHVYVSWTESRIINSNVLKGVFFTRSTDGGKTFEQSNYIHGNLSGSGLPISMVAKDGKIFIAYPVLRHVDILHQYVEIWLATSSDDGLTFSKHMISEASGTNKLSPSIDVVGTDVYLSWKEDNKILFSRSENGGLTFGNRKILFGGISGSTSNIGRTHVKATQNHEVYVVFDNFLVTQSPFSTDKEVFFLKSSDDGTTFSAAARLSDDPPDSKNEQENPSLTLLPDGSPVIAWKEIRNNIPKFMLTYSLDGGNTFVPNIDITNTTPSSAPRAPTIVADSQGNIHFIRLTNAFNPTGIYYTKIDLGLQTQTGPEPFLELPWDYQSKGLDFNQAALTINSYLDHTYPLLSSSLAEPQDSQNQVTTYLGENSTSKYYSSHDGYDYGKSAEAEIGDPVLASADGCASYFYNSGAGNAIKIDHANFYQTRYYHLQDEGLVTLSAECTNVAQGQQIGKIGATGNSTGAHIHFMVVEDKNKDGNFEDNIPDGITDPFGWQNENVDPWTGYAFNYTGEDRTGNKSYYLWKEKIAGLVQTLTSNAKLFELENYQLSFPQGAVQNEVVFEINSAPQTESGNLESIGPTLIVTAKNALGEFVEQFTKPYTIKIDFSAFDTSTLNLATISIYSSPDGSNWNMEETTVDLENKEATATLDHLTHFALMAESLDTTAPTTTPILSGLQGQTNWFRTDVQLLLDADDNDGGLGIDYTLYRLENGDWQEYTNPLTFSQEGSHTVEFYSADLDENIEYKQTITFNIDKTSPEAKLKFNPAIKKIEITSDASEEVKVITTLRKSELTDKAGNSLTLLGTFLNRNNQSLVSLKSPYSGDFVANFAYSKNILKSLTQTWKRKGDITIQITYNKTTNKSIIKTSKFGQKPKIETKVGLILLELKTNQGKIEYSY